MDDQIAVERLVQQVKDVKPWIVARANRSNERDLLKGYEFQTLHFKSDGRILQSIPAPSQGWSHEMIEGLSAPGVFWDAYLGTQWIGSSEI